MRALVVCLLMMLPVSAMAQGFKVAFGGLAQDPDAPVEVVADTLAVDQTNGSAVFTGNVKITQNVMVLTAPKVTVFYNEDTQGVARLEASGGVTIINERDKAVSETADYDIEAGNIVMVGDVVLTQGLNQVSSNNMTIDLNKGTAEMHGRVKTVLRRENSSGN